MRVLFITARFPYPIQKGDKLRSYFLLRELSEKHEIILVSLSDEKVKSEDVEHIRKMVSEVYLLSSKPLFRWLMAFLFLFTRYPIQVGYFYSRRFKRLIYELIQDKKPEHIFCQMIRTALYVKKYPKIPKTLDYQDVLSFGIKRRIEKSSNSLLKLIYGIEYRRLKRFENKIFDWFTNKIIISEADRSLIPNSRREEITIIKNGVDFEFFNTKNFQETEKKFDLLFTGNMGYPPNIDCATFIITEILPEVLSEFPDIRLVIAGANPPGSLLKYQSSNVYITGWVDDIRTFYALSKIFLAPMRIGTGLQNKLLEAMSMKLPCVTTDLANNPIGSIHDRDILVGNSTQELVHLLIRLLKSPRLAEEIATNGYQYVHRNYSWKEHADLLEQLISNSGKKN